MTLVAEFFFPFQFLKLCCFSSGEIFMYDGERILFSPLPKEMQHFREREKIPIAFISN